MAYVMVLLYDQRNSPHFECRDDPGRYDSERADTDTTFYLASRGLPIPADRFPKQAKTISKRKVINDILYAAHMKWAVPERVRDILELHAPGQVEFIPVVLTRRGGALVNNSRYFYMNIRTGLRTVQWDKVTFKHKVHPNGWREIDSLFRYAPTPDHGLQVDRTGHEDVKIWYELDAGPISQWVFTSDDILAALAKAGVTGPIAYHVPEVSRSERQDQAAPPTA